MTYSWLGILALGNGRFMTYPVIMKNISESGKRWTAALLFLMLAVSFVWCIVDNIIMSAQASDVIEETTVAIIGAILWLVAHGIHGAAVIALPALIWRHGDGKERSHVY